jgi:cytochrome b subunit of formate dehydrogenase
MGLSFAFLALALGSSRLERITRWVFSASSALIVAAFAGMSLYFGFGLESRFEVTAISLGWLTLMISGVLLAFVFRRSAHRR